MGIRGHTRSQHVGQSQPKSRLRITTPISRILIAHARKLYAQDRFAVELEQTVYAFDSTTIDLCLTLFPWAKFRRRKAAVKLHTLIDLRGNIPCFVHISNGKMHDVKSLDHLPIEPGAFYVMDRGYIDFTRLYRFQLTHGFLRHSCQKRTSNFVAKKIVRVDKTTGLRCDQTSCLREPTRQTSIPNRYDASSMSIPTRASALCSSPTTLCSTH